MRGGYPTLLTLLESELEPSRKFYDDTVKAIIRHPELISSLTQNDPEEALLHLTQHSHRLAQLFDCLHDFQKLLPERPIKHDQAAHGLPPKALTRDRIASETVTFLLNILPTFHGIIESAQVVELLVPALENCLLSSPPMLRKLASVIAGYDGILEHLACDESGGETVRRWVCLFITTTQDTATLKTWTRRLVDLVESCAAKHGVLNDIQRWQTLTNLIKALHRLQENVERQSKLRSQQWMQEATYSSARMTPLNPEDKRAYVSKMRKEPEVPDLKIDTDLLMSLQQFELQAPTSRSELQEAIQTLERETTTSILRTMANTFPCKLCKEALGLPTPRTSCIVTTVSNENPTAVSNLEIDILGKQVGEWKVLLSTKALKSIQGLNHLGSHFGPIQDKILALASGEWKYRLAGSEKQRKLLKVPLATTKCGLNTFILWQVDIGITGEMKVPGQLIKIWEVGDPSEISKCIERVAILQRTYSKDIIHRCQKRPPSLDGKKFPAQFEDHTQGFAVPSRNPSDLDVRVVDPDTIDMANKFYALTEPMIQAILANDLTAELPFDLSSDEIQVIGHFQTASLILGRSGTGKTTCLAFKLVGKYLARRKLQGAKPLRQVLLTRSSFLADKLRSYVWRLIETLMTKSLKMEVLREENEILSNLAEGARTNDSALTLDDDSYPLVCTFDRFLELLENTVRAMDRKSFHESENYGDNKGQAVKLTAKRPRKHLVDFQTFKLDYWPHLPHSVTKHVDVNLVFAEIMGVIKGSTSSRQSLAPLSRDMYLTRSSRLAPNFQSEAERSLVYEAFQAYEEQKLASEGVDHIDRVVKLLGAVRGDPFLRQILASTFDEVYIDEVQDQRCLDFELLLSFIKDSRGFHFAGDTAQAISQDSTFRFADIKALLYDHFAAAGAAANQKEIVQATMFTLSKNYRSHQGILALASQVMAMLWKGFPDMVDKLEPEIGHLTGPKPVLFVGFDTEILVSSNAGHVKLAGRSADFGAEQVILVRDEKEKAKLQRQIGNIALVLTILQSKGMEFDDVVLWNFFSGSPNPGGIRSLNALVKDDATVFDARKNSHLYVAVTRARIQLFLIESDEIAIASVIKLLTQDVPEPVVEVTRPTDINFMANLENLRPGTSNDPRRWLFRAEQLMQQKNYKDALICFVKAQNRRGETMARAKIHEEDGRICLAKDDVEGSRRNLEAAVKLFLEINLIGEASNNLIRMNEYSRAGELWYENKEYGKAAKLFMNSDLHEKAADCYHLDGKCSEAAATLRTGSKYERLARYLNSNREQISNDTYRIYSRLYKMLLKQGKISHEHREDAIAILGSSAEQEACFIEYEMYDDLIKIYQEQRRYEDLFPLLVKLRLFEEALNLWLNQQSSGSAAGVPESDVLNLVDYVWAGRIMGASQKGKAAKSFQNRVCIVLPKIARKFQQWEDAYRIYTLGSSSQKYTSLEDSEIKAFLVLQSILDATPISHTSDLDSLPFEVIHEATKVSKDLVLKGDNQTRRIIYLLMGVWTMNDSKRPPFLLTWSPLRTAIADASAVDVRQIAEQWVLDRFASTILALDIKLRELFKKKHPIRCWKYELKGFCSKRGRGEDCLLLHKRLNTADFLVIVEDLRRANAIFCDLTVLHRRETMMVKFQEGFLPIRRYWIEHFLRQLTYISSFDQSASIISKIQTGELCRDRASTIGTCVEDLLYHRISKDWAQRSAFSSLLEQMQLAKTFGPKFETRFFRHLSYKLLNISHRAPMQKHLGLLNWLENDTRTPNPLQFQRKLYSFLIDLERLDLEELLSMHAVTTTMEYLALLLILKASSQWFIVPQSWIELHIPRMSQRSLLHKQLGWEDIEIYRECLLRLVQTFSRLLTRLDKELQHELNFFCSGRVYNRSALQQRNAELLAVGLANLPTFQSGISQLRLDINAVFRCSSIRADHLIHKTPDELRQKLPSSFAMYEDKNLLVIVSRDLSKDLHQKNLSSKFRKEAGVTTRSIDDVHSLMIRSTLDNTAGKTPDITVDEKYAKVEIEAASRIQIFWRSIVPKFKLRQQYIMSPKAQAIQFYIDMGLRHSAPIELRALLVSRGVEAHLRLPILRDSITEQRKATMSCVIDGEISDQSSQILDNALQMISQLDHSLDTAVEGMSEGNLGKFLSRGMLSNVQGAMKVMEKTIKDVEEGVVKVRDMITGLSDMNRSTTG